MTIAQRLGRLVRTVANPKAAQPKHVHMRSNPPITDTASPEELAILELAGPQTMGGDERMLANIDAIDYVVRRDIPGAIVECGVWRGGQILIMIERLKQLGVDDRDFYLYDTFAGMTAPTDEDVSPYIEPAVETWAATPPGEVAWASLLGDPSKYQIEGVRGLLTSTGYPVERLHLIKGPVEETVPEHAPAEIALLRLDTDWYESTAHEMRHLYPRLADGGVLIVDDYGHWEGARKAVDEYFASSAAPIMLSRIDYTARIGIKR
ncbi:MAG: TylF/MycF/NovP-related O-methyltransferase [Mycobacteriales bacterium]